MTSIVLGAGAKKNNIENLMGETLKSSCFYSYDRATGDIQGAMGLYKRLCPQVWIHREACSLERGR